MKLQRKFVRQGSYLDIISLVWLKLLFTLVKPIYYEMDDELKSHSNLEVKNLAKRGAIVKATPSPDQVTSGIFGRYKKNHTELNTK